MARVKRLIGGHVGETECRDGQLQRGQRLSSATLAPSVSHPVGGPVGKPVGDELGFGRQGLLAPVQTELYPQPPLALSLLVVYYAFLPPEYSFELKGRKNVVNMTLFAAGSGLIIWLAQSYRNVVRELTEVDHERQIMFDEIQHRGRNSLAVVQTILTNTLREQPELSRNLLGRLRAVLSSDDLCLKDAQIGELLRNIVNSELEPFGPDRYEAVGSEIKLSARHARNWALIVHELATNASKHGALSEADGKVLVTWFLENDALNFEWREVGKARPPDTTPSSGFGSKLIDAMTKGLSGTITRSFEPTGLRCEIVVPVDNTALRSAKPPETAAAIASSNRDEPSPGVRDQGR